MVEVSLFSVPLPPHVTEYTLYGDLGITIKGQEERQSMANGTPVLKSST